MTGVKDSSRGRQNSNEQVRQLLGKVQFDRWMLAGSSPKISVMSHGDIDHNPQAAKVPNARPVAVTVRFRFSLTGVVGADKFICDYDSLNQLNYVRPEGRRV